MNVEEILARLTTELQAATGLEVYVYPNTESVIPSPYTKTTQQDWPATATGKEPGMERDPFGFTVSRDHDGEGGPDRWAVMLPHQCDFWEITEGPLGRHTTHEAAVEQLEAFIVAAQVALAKLRNREEQAPWA